MNEAVEGAHRSGVLSAASLMVGGAAADDAVRRAHAMPGLRVGLHVVLVDGDPVLPPAQIPNLVDRSGRLRSDMTQLGIEIACRSELRRQLRSEILAQFEAYRQTGLALDHVNTHKHFHLHPMVMRAIVDIGGDFGMRALRIPAEPIRTVSRIDRTPGTSRWMLLPWIGLSRAFAHRAGLLLPHAVFGRAWSGGMDRRRLIGLIENLPEGLIEIYMHPATVDDFPGSAQGYCYRQELEALCDPAVIAAVRRSGTRVGGYGDASDARPNVGRMRGAR